MRDTGLPVIIVTNRGPKTGVIRRTASNESVAASQGGAPKRADCYHNLKAEPNVEIRDVAEVYTLRVREVVDPVERRRLWYVAVAAYPRYHDNQDKADQATPVFIEETAD